MKEQTCEHSELIDAFENAVLGEQAAEREGSDSEYEAASIRLIDARKSLLAVLAADAQVPLAEHEILTLSRPLKGIYTNISHGDVLRFVSSIEEHHGIKP